MAEPKDESREQRFDSYAVLGSNQERRALLLPAGSAWSLPHVQSTLCLEQPLQELNEAFRSQLGVNLMLRALGSRGQSKVYLFEPRGPLPAPPEGRWVSRAELPGLPLAVPEHRALLEDWFGEGEAGAVPALRAPWAHSGWFDPAAEWMLDQVRRLGLTPTGPVEQFRSWSISCLLRLATHAGGVLLKAVPPVYRHEPLLTQALSRRYPGQLPEVLAVEPERHWILMREFDGELLGEVEDLSVRGSALRRFAQMQIDLVDSADWLLSLGCPDRRLERLAARTDPLLADRAALVPDGDERLTEAEIEQLRALSPRLKALCAELAVGPVPATLVHGDLHAYNMVLVDGESLIFDWSDSSLSHPFLDLVPLLGPGGWPEIPDARHQLRDAYLEPWTRFAPLPELIPLFAKAQILGALYQALSYSEITAAIEAREEMAAGVPGFLKRLLLEAAGS